MKVKIFVAMAASAALLMSCKEVINITSGLKGETVVASGPTVKQERQMSDISEIDVSNGLSVVYVQNPTLKLTVEAPENIQEYILTEIKNGELSVKTKPNTSLRINGGKVLVTVMAPSVNEFDVSSGASVAIKEKYSNPTGSVSIDVSSGASFAMASLTASSAEIEVSSGASASVAGIEVDSFEASASSGASLSLSGRAATAELKSSGGASISASGFKADAGEVSASGGASVSSSIRNASVHSSGGGSVNNH